MSGPQITPKRIKEYKKIVQEKDFLFEEAEVHIPILRSDLICKNISDHLKREHIEEIINEMMIRVHDRIAQKAAEIITFKKHYPEVVKICEGVL